MKVLRRSTDLKSPHAIKENKMLVCFNWLYEFKFSNYDVISSLLGTETKLARAFFKTLIDQEYLTVFTNVNVPANIRFVALTQQGVNFLIAHGLLNEEAKAYNYTRFKKIVQIFHHLEVQKYLIANLDRYIEITWDYNITVNQEELKPDAILQLSQGAKVALEYEKWVKSKARVFHNFYKHFENISKGYYAGVIYVFDNEADKQTYKNLFDQGEWPRYRFQTKDSKPVQLSTTFKPSTVEGLANAFKFTVK